MKQHYLLLVLCCIFLCGPNLHAQSLELCRQVIGFAGSSAVSQGHNFSYTLGEPVVGTRTGQDVILTQGFHQPELCVLVNVSTLELDDRWQISLFPNPTSALLQLQWQGEWATPAYQYNVYHSNGQLVLHSGPNTLQDSLHEIDCRKLPAGSYFLQLKIQDQAQPKSIPFIVAPY